MGTLYQYSCPKCNTGDMFTLGIGMRFNEDERELILFECTHCKKYFSQNKNLKRNRCYNCQKKPLKVEYKDIEELHCPKCKESQIEVTGIGNWD
jgi:phage FluMu protein Com